MNFLLTIIFVISTIDICNVNAEWNHKCTEKFGDYFDIFIKKMSSIAIKSFLSSATHEGNPNSLEITQIQGNQINYTNGLKAIKRPNFGLNDYNNFVYFTKPSIDFVLNKVIPNRENGIDVIASIMSLCQDINNDSGISLEYKYANLLFRNELMNFFVSHNYGKENDFDTQYCYAKEEFASSTARWPGETFSYIFGTYFYTFIETMSSITMASFPSPTTFEEDLNTQEKKTAIIENQKHYINVLTAMKLLMNHYHNLDALLYCTDSKIDFLLRNVFPNVQNTTAILVSIKKLCNDINNDSCIPVDYKYAELPFREELKKFFLFLNNHPEDFDTNYCRLEKPEDGSSQNAQKRRSSKRKSSGRSSKSPMT